MEWQPIDTAPKDGRNVVLWTGDCPESFYAPNLSVVVAGWHEEWGTWISNFCVDNYASIDDPTHWMPLPEPPK